MAGNDDLASALRALKGNGAARTKIARLRDVLDEVEDALAAGVKQDAMLEVLNARGFEMSKTAFKSALRRLRNERRTSGKAKG